MFLRDHIRLTREKEYKLRRLYPEYPKEDKIDELDEKFLNDEIGERQYTLELRRILHENKLWFLNASKQIDKIFEPYFENQRKRQKTKEPLFCKIFRFFS